MKGSMKTTQRKKGSWLRLKPWECVHLGFEGEAKEDEEEKSEWQEDNQKDTEDKEETLSIKRNWLVDGIKGHR